MAVQVGLVLGISILVAVLGTASAGAGLDLFRTAWWIAGGSVLVAGIAALLVTPRRRRLSTLADGPSRTAAASDRDRMPSRARTNQRASNMTAITRGSVTEAHELGRFIDHEKRAAGRSSPAPGRGPYRPTLRRRPAFWLLAAVLCLLFVATAAPAPLYGVYQAEWHFSVTTLTAVFAVYAFVLLVTLLMFGSVSDYLGRRGRSSRGSRRMGWRAACSWRPETWRRCSSRGLCRVSLSAWAPARWGQRCSNCNRREAGSRRL
jgi:hypothetical protein